LKADEVAIFGLITGVPSYVSFLFGFARDNWNPLGMGDRGFVVLFGGLCAAVYGLFADRFWWSICCCGRASFSSPLHRMD
jgi:hypothetical protein